MKRKKTYLVTSILFAIGAVVWSVNVYIYFQSRENPDALPVLQFCCVLAFIAAAVVNFVRYRRSNRNQGDK